MTMCVSQQQFRHVQTQPMMDLLLAPKPFPAAKAGCFSSHNYGASPDCAAVQLAMTVCIRLQVCTDTAHDGLAAGA